MLRREESLRAIPAQPAVVMLAALLAALLATSLAIFSFGMHPARHVGLQRALGHGQGQIEPYNDRQAER
ncbi:MAG TPA: hypothetical protein VGV91_19170, partial [Rubrobacter sp.]|nr:hypothetical protein [Rubrobacter sp.]